MDPSPSIATTGPGSNRSGLSSYALFCCALLLVLFLRLQVIWPMGLHQDDAAYSTVRVEGELEGYGLLAKSHQFFKSFTIYQGRFKPVACYVVFPLQLAVEDNRMLFRASQALAQLATLGVFALLCARLSRNNWFWGITLLVFASFYELRDFHDAAFGQFILCPFTAFLGSLGCYFALRGAEPGSPTFNRHIGLAALFSLLALCTMELALPFSLLAALFSITGANRWRIRFWRGLITGLPIVLIGGLDAYLRSKSLYDGTQTGSFSPSILGHTYYGQLISAFPLSYFYYDPHRLFATSWLWTTDTLGAGVGGAVAAAALFFGLKHLRPRNRWLLLALGGALLLLPSAMISVSLKYQKVTSPGLGYLQTAFCYLGTSILTALLLGMIAESLQRWPRLSVAFRGLAAIGVGAVLTCSILCSQRVAQSVNSVWRFPREMSEVWLRATRPAPGALETIVTEAEWPARWESPAYLLMVRGSRGRYFTRSSFAEQKPVLPPESTLVRLRFPSRISADNLGLVIGSFQAADGSGPSRITAFVISNDETKLRDARLQLAAPGNTWNFPGETKIGRRGYYYRRLDLAEQSAALADFGLLIR